MGEPRLVGDREPLRVSRVGPEERFRQHSVVSQWQAAVHHVCAVEAVGEPRNLPTEPSPFESELRPSLVF